MIDIQQNILNFPAKKLRVLVACEFSGVVREAFRSRGHDAWSCDIVPARDGSEFHIQGEVQLILEDGWDMMIAHPPCTYLCSSGLHWNKRIPGRDQLTHEAVLFFSSLTEAPIPRIAVENPVGCLSTHYGKPSQIIQPFQFGEDASKKTCLWLKNMPILRPTKLIPPRLVCCGAVLPDGVGERGCANCNGDKKALPRWGNQTGSGQNKLGPSEERSNQRSVTYQGIADAMASQWGNLEAIGKTEQGLVAA